MNDEDSLALPRVSEAPGESAARTRTSPVAWLLVALLACAVIVLAVTLVLVLDRSPTEASLREERDELRSELADARRELESTEQQLAKAMQVVGARDTVPGDDADRAETRGITEVGRGVIATDGDLAFRVVDARTVAGFRTWSEAYRPEAGAAYVQVRTQVANDGTKAADPFCGGNGIRLVDAKGREFRSLSASISIDGNETCSDGIPPGFRNVETLVFEVPAGATPAAVELWNRDDGDDYFGEATRIRVTLD